MEVWKDIDGFEGLYQVSNYGRVKSRYAIRKKPTTNNGYEIVKLCKNGEVKHSLVHRLVAQAFIPNPFNFPCINHKDENKRNNIVENLEWCTRAYNNKYSRAIKVVQYDKNGGYIGVWESIVDASNALHIDNSLISKCCRHKRKSAGGFIWEYEKAVI